MTKRQTLLAGSTFFFLYDNELFDILDRIERTHLRGEFMEMKAPPEELLRTWHAEVVTELRKRGCGALHFDNAIRRADPDAHIRRRL